MRLGWAQRWLLTIVGFVACASAAQIVAGSMIAFYAARRGAYEWLHGCLVTNTGAFDDVIYTHLSNGAGVLLDGHVAATFEGVVPDKLAATLDAAWSQRQPGDRWIVVDAEGTTKTTLPCDARDVRVSLAALDGQRGFISCDGVPHLVARADGSGLHGEAVWTARALDVSYVEALHRFTGSEVEVLATSSSPTTMRDLEGRLIVVALPPDAAAVDEWFGVVDVNVPAGYAGFAYSERRAVDRGARRVEMFAAARRIAGTDARVVLLAPTSAVTTGAYFSALAMLLMSVVTTLLLFLLARRLVARFMRPLVAVERGARAVADGDLSARVPIDGDAELASVATSFNAMVDKLTQSLDAMLQSEKLAAMGRLAAGVAHEMNTPINFVTGNVDFLRERLQNITIDDEKLRLEFPSAIDDSLEGLRRLASIVRSMKEFSHSSGAQRTNQDLGALIQSTVTLARPEWKYVAALDTDVEPDLPLVPVLRDELSQALLNLIVNAAHAIEERFAGEEHGRIAVDVRRESKCVIIAIRDNGAGMAPEVRARLFEPFFTTKPVGKGTGQGLAMVYAVIVKKHAGTIDVESTPGLGTTFTVRLPLAPTPASSDVGWDEMNTPVTGPTA